MKYSRGIEIRAVLQQQRQLMKMTSTTQGHPIITLSSLIAVMNQNEWWI